jgi:hypothetical protein
LAFFVSGSWGDDTPTVSGSGSALATSVIASRSNFSGGAWAMTVRGGGLYAAKPGLINRVGCIRQYSPNAKHAAAAQ